MLPLSCRQNSTLKSFRSKDPWVHEFRTAIFPEVLIYKVTEEDMLKVPGGKFQAHHDRVDVKVMVWVSFDLYKLREKKPFAENNVSEC